jgi:hypothetical protein
MSDRIPWGMTLRELLDCLRATDEKSLDMEVVVCHPSGGYSPISHTSVLHAGLTVVHLAEPKATEAVPDVWGESGDAVAEVDPDDLRSVWKMTREVQAYNQGQSVALSAAMYQSMCSPGADVMAVWYRASILGMLQMLPEGPLKPWTNNGVLDAAVFQVAAKFPMKRMRVGVVHQGPPFDVQVFLKHIEYASGQK